MGAGMNFKPMAVIALIFFLQTFLMAENSSVAIIKNFSGSIKIVYNNQPITPAKFLALEENTTISVDPDAILVLFMKNGEKMSFSGKAKFKVDKSGIKALDKDTEMLLASSTKSRIYAKVETQASRKVLLKPVKKVPPECKAEIDEISASVSDPSLAALLKGEIYRRYNLPQQAAEQFKIHKELTNQDYPDATDDAEEVIE
jgi:hypothetical protein